MDACDDESLGKSVARYGDADVEVDDRTAVRVTSDVQERIDAVNLAQRIANSNGYIGSDGVGTTVKNEHVCESAILSVEEPTSDRQTRVENMKFHEAEMRGMTLFGDLS
ncbi:hypothetical protein RB195_018662 [Necator americanus]|uniref:Late endosomal/lysosomal adaptor and MAPK and MTOR activator 1 n=1 Tax=Necator americanus TaxID=51031 RepID=A0ABR1CCX8_NECAM